MTEKAKREMRRIIGPKQKFLTLKEREKAVIENTGVEHRDEFQKIIAEYRDVFWDKLIEETPPSRDITHSIEVLLGSEPAYWTPFRLRPADQDELEKQVRSLLDQSFICPSQSSYGAPILFIPKKDGHWRMCIDHHALNRQTVKDRYPLPRIDMLLDRLGQARVFTKLDLAFSYHQRAMYDRSIYKSAFTTDLWQWEFLVMPFGLCNALATFQRLMNKVFTTEINNFVLVYLDDILVFSHSIEEHWSHLRQAL